MQSKLEHALALAAAGFHVFPLEPDGKLPAISNFPTKATRDVKQITDWWTDPVLDVPLDRNIGISTSAYGDDKALLVVDVDTKGKANGLDTILALDLEGKTLPPTLEAATPSGGRHLIYVVDSPLSQGANVLGPGVDTRSKGGFIVGVGSTIGGTAYEWMQGRDPATVSDVVRAPTWCVQACSSSVSDRPRHEAAPAVEVDRDAATDRAVDYLNSLEAATAGGRNHAAYAAACRLKDFGLDPLDTAAVMLNHWKCEPMLDDGELDHCINSAYRYGKNQQGSESPEAQFTPINAAGAMPERLGLSDHGQAQEGLHPFDKINREYAFVTAGGGHHILWETHDQYGRAVLEHLNESSFHAKHAAWQGQIGNRTKAWTKQWMESDRRRSYDRICFMPEQQAPENFYNLWRGFAVKPSDKADANNDGLVMWIDHIRDNVCDGDKALSHWLIGYFAHMVQRPWDKPLVSIVLRGGKGVGKNVAIETVGHLFGGHSLLASDRRYLVGNFNGHLENCLLFTLDEAFWSGDRQAEGVLKNLITGKNHVIEHKGKEPYTVENRTRVAIIGNEDWLVPASHDERRFAVFDVNDRRKQDTAYFRKMRKGMESGGYESLLRFLMDYEIAGLDFSTAPQTRGLLDQKHESLAPLEQWWFESLTEGQIVGYPIPAQGDPWPDKLYTEQLRDALESYCRRRRIKTRIPDARAFGVRLRRLVPALRRTRVRTGERLHWVYEVPALNGCRRSWDRFIGHDVEWE